MAVQNDDWDIRKSWFYTEVGGNGDYYLNTAQEDRSGKITTHTIRVTTSGSRYPSEVMLAICQLHRVLENYDLNSNILNKEIEFKRGGYSVMKEYIPEPDSLVLIHQLGWVIEELSVSPDKVCVISVDDAISIFAEDAKSVEMFLEDFCELWAEKNRIVCRLVVGEKGPEYRFFNKNK